MIEGYSTYCSIYGSYLWGPLKKEVQTAVYGLVWIEFLFLVSLGAEAEPWPNS